MKETNPRSHNTSQNVPKKEVNEEQLSSLKLSGQQQALYKAILEKDPRMADMYLGSLRVLSDTGNSDRLALSAHGLRELMEKIPSIVDVQIKAQKESLKNKVRDLEDHWRTTVKNSKCHNDQNWSGNIDNALLKLLGRMQDFFGWFNEHNPRRKAEVVKTLRKLDRSGRILPEPLEELNIQSWEKMKGFFVAVSHHGKNPSAEEFNHWLDALERFLLDRLHPRTFADFDTIDEIIREGESDA